MCVEISRGSTPKHVARWPLRALPTGVSKATSTMTEPSRVHRKFRGMREMQPYIRVGNHGPTSVPAFWALISPGEDAASGVRCGKGKASFVQFRVS